MIAPGAPCPSCDAWTARLKVFIPQFITANPALAPVRDDISVALHGSTTFGIDDEHSDLDLWLLLPQERLAAFDAASPTRFLEFELAGKKGHASVTATEEFARQIDRCDMDLIFQARLARLIYGDGSMDRLLDRARKPMRPEVRDGLFLWHYTEMRGEHRACDTPIERGDAVALLLALPKAMAHAMQAAMVLQGQPYPYRKWLYRAAVATPVGVQLQPSLQELLDILAADGLRQGGPEKQNAISLELRAIRKVLIDAARSRGIDAPWLDKWWLYIDLARDTFRALRW